MADSMPAFNAHPPPPPPPPYCDEPQNLSYASLLHRTRHVLHRKTPQLKEALRQFSTELVEWVRRGGVWRAFLVITVGGLALLTLSGFFAFILFFVTATVNAVAIGLLASVVAVAVPFFAVLTAIYIGALITAVVTVSILPFFTICAALIAAGWLAFALVVWQGCTTGANLCRRLVLFAASAITGLTSLGAEKSYKSAVMS